MSHEKNYPGRIPLSPEEDSLRAAHRLLGGSEATVFGDSGESRAERSTREGRALWRWAHALYAMLGAILTALAVVTFSGIMKPKDD